MDASCAHPTHDHCVCYQWLSYTALCIFLRVAFVHLVLVWFMTESQWTVDSHCYKVQYNLILHTGTHFTNRFSIAIRTQWKFLFLSTFSNKVVVIPTKSCTCCDNYAFVPCANNCHGMCKIYSDQVASNWIAAKQSSLRIEMPGKPFAKWAPTLQWLELCMNRG